MLNRSVVSDSATPWTVACQAPLSMGFSRQEYWSGLPFSSPGDLPYSKIEPGSTALWVDSLLSEPQLPQNTSGSCLHLYRWKPRYNNFASPPPFKYLISMQVLFYKNNLELFLLCQKRNSYAKNMVLLLLAPNNIWKSSQLATHISS